MVFAVFFLRGFKQEQEPQDFFERSSVPPRIYKREVAESHVELIDFMTCSA